MSEIAWQPIETAPRDGTAILVPDDAWGTMPVRWVARQERGAWQTHGAYERHPAWWMPIPPKPHAAPKTTKPRPS